MSLAEWHESIKEWVTAVHEAEKRVWQNELGDYTPRQLPSWSVAVYDNFVDTRQPYPYEETGKHYHRAHELGIAPTEMAQISRAMWGGTAGELLKAVESGIPSAYLRAVNDAYRDHLRHLGHHPGPCPVFSAKRLYDTSVPAPYAAAFLRQNGLSSGRIIELYEAGIPAEFAVEMAAD